MQYVKCNFNLRFKGWETFLMAVRYMHVPYWIKDTAMYFDCFIHNFTKTCYYHKQFMIFRPINSHQTCVSLCI